MDHTIQEEIKAHLMNTSEEFRTLFNQHHEYDRLVEALEAKHVLTAEEEVEEHRLKKLKLHAKDEMERMIAEHPMQHAG